jgi:hypothetical protein
MWDVSSSVQGGHKFFEITKTPKNSVRIAVVEFALLHTTDPSFSLLNIMLWKMY